MAYTEKESNELKKLNGIKSPSAKQKARIAALKAMKNGTSSTSSQVNTQAGKDIKTTLGEAGTIYDGSGLNIPLERQDLNSVVSPETQGLINSVQDSLNPASANYVGAISPALQASLDKLQAGVAISPEEREQLEVLKGAQSRTQDTSDAIAAIKGGLAGLSSEENTAMRDRASQAASSTLASSIANIQKAASRSGTRNVFAGGAMNKATEGFGRQRLDDEREQMLANIDIQDRRRGQFADVVGGAEQREAGRRNDYTNSLMTSKNNEFGRQRDYTSTSGGIENDNKNRVQAGQLSLGGMLQGKDNSLNDTRRFNIGQGNAEAAARAGGIANIGGLINERDYGNEMVKISKSSSSRSSSGRRGDGRNRNLGAVATDPGKTYIDNVEKLINNR